MKKTTLMAASIALACSMAASPALAERWLGRNGEWASVKWCAEAKDFPCKKILLVKSTGGAQQETAAAPVGRQKNQDTGGNTDLAIYCNGDINKVGTSCYGDKRKCTNANAGNGRTCSAVPI